MNVLSHRPAFRIVLITCLLLASLRGAQALAAKSAPPGGVSDTGRVLGRTGFAFVGGLRTFVAAVLWNRIEPQFDTYYGGRFDKAFASFLPTVRLVQALDPQFEQSYYVASFWLQRFGHPAEGLALARDGLQNNPRSGLMRANLAQVLMSQDRQKNLPRVLELAREGVGPEVTWLSIDDRFEGLGIFAAIFSIAGDTEMAAKVRFEQEQLKSQGAVLDERKP